MRALSDEQVRDQALTLLFAGHDTTTSTVAFLFYELARDPSGPSDWPPSRTLVGDGVPSGEQLFGELPLLAQAVDETLRLYPPAWVGPRRAAVDFEFAGHRIPAGVPVNYSSWASHRLPEVFCRPGRVPAGALRAGGAGGAAEGRLRPVRRRAADLHRDALRPARGERDRGRILGRYRVDLEPGWELQIRQMPTLSPQGGLPMRVRPP